MILSPSGRSPPVGDTCPNSVWHVKDAKRLGAQVLSQSENEWTRTALIRDPEGAEFTASQFTAPSP